MKIWNSYGSEHSANLVMIGKFKDVVSAEKAKEAIDEITAVESSINKKHRDVNRFSDEEMKVLNKIKFYTIAPAELEQFTYDIQTELKDESVIVKTDETDVSAFLKLLIDKGARVEVYSLHDYPDASTKKNT